MERKWNGNGAGREREGNGKGKERERKNEGQNNIFCAKTCKCQIFFVTLQAGRNWGNNRRNTAENRTPLRLRENREENVTRKGKRTQQG